MVGAATAAVGAVGAGRALAEAAEMVGAATAAVGAVGAVGTGRASWRASPAPSLATGYQRCCPTACQFAGCATGYQPGTTLALVVSPLAASQLEASPSPSQRLPLSRSAAASTAATSASPSPSQTLCVC